MWNIHRLFEQTHTDPSLYETDPVLESLDLSWLHDDARLGG